MKWSGKLVEVQKTPTHHSSGFDFTRCYSSLSLEEKEDFATFLGYDFIDKENEVHISFMWNYYGRKDNL